MKTKRSWVRFGLAKFLTQITDSIYVIFGGGSVVGTLFPVTLPWLELGGKGLHLMILVDLQSVGFCRGWRRWVYRGWVYGGYTFPRSHKKKLINSMLLNPTP